MPTCATAKHWKSSAFCIVTDTVISRLYEYDALLPFVSLFSVKNIKTKLKLKLCFIFITFSFMFVLQFSILV